MKKIWILSLLLLIAGTAQAQVIISLLLGDKINSGKVEFGLDGGVNYSWLTGQPYGKAFPTFNLGFYFDIKLKQPRWMIHTGVIVKSNMGTAGLPVYPLNDPNLDNSFAGGNVERTLNYFNVPVMIKHTFTSNIYVETGTMLGLLYNAHDNFSASVNGQELTYEVDTRDLYRAIDAGFMAGIGYRLMKGEGMNFSVRAYQGLVDVRKQPSGDAMMNQSLYFTVGIPIGAGKARERAAGKEESK